LGEVIGEGITGRGKQPFDGPGLVCVERAKAGRLSFRSLLAGTQGRIGRLEKKNGRRIEATGQQM